MIEGATEAALLARGADGRDASRERVVVLEPGRAARDYWSDVWRYRELFAILAWRDVAVRYKQTVIGVAWSVLRPLLTLIVFVVVFDRIARLPSDGSVPYPLLIYAGLLPWFLFASILSEASQSLVMNANLVAKVYFPRVVIPLSTAVVALVDFLVASLILAGLMLWYGSLPDARVAALPVFVLLALATAIGPALLLAALNVKYRDFRFIIPFIVQFGLYLSPVGFSSAIIPESWRLIFNLNPMVGVIDGFRWCLLAGQSPLHVQGLAVSVSVALLLLVIGVVYFRRTEREFADHI